jgi:hypothetical protein
VVRGREKAALIFPRSDTSKRGCMNETTTETSALSTTRYQAKSWYYTGARGHMLSLGETSSALLSCRQSKPQRRPLPLSRAVRTNPATVAAPPASASPTVQKREVSERARAGGDGRELTVSLCSDEEKRGSARWTGTDFEGRYENSPLATALSIRLLRL